MPLRKLLRLFFRNFPPLIKRAFALLFRSKRKPVIESLEIEQGPGETVATTFQLKIKNGMVLGINGNLLPVFSDSENMRITVPNNQKSIKIKVKGLFGSIERKIPVTQNSARLLVPRIDRNTLTKNVSFLNKNYGIVNAQFELIQGRPKILTSSNPKLPNLSLENLDISEIENELASNNISYGQ